MSMRARKAKSLLERKCLIPSGFVEYRNGKRTRAEAISRDSRTAFVLDGIGERSLVGVRVGGEATYTSHPANTDYACPACDQ